MWIIDLFRKNRPEVYKNRRIRFIYQGNVVSENAVKDVYFHSQHRYIISLGGGPFGLQSDTYRAKKIGIRKYQVDLVNDLLEED